MSGAQQRRWYRSFRRYWIISGITKKGKKIIALRTHSPSHALAISRILVRGTIVGFGEKAKTLVIGPR